MLNKQRVIPLMGFVIISCFVVIVFINSLILDGKEVTKNNFIEFDAIITKVGYQRDADHFVVKNKKNHYVTFERDYTADAFEILSRTAPKEDLKLHVWYMDYSGNVYYESDEIWKKGQYAFHLENIDDYISLISISTDSDFDAYMTISYNQVNEKNKTLIKLISCLGVLLIIIVLWMFKKIDGALDFFWTKMKRTLLLIRYNIKTIVGALSCVVLAFLVLWLFAFFSVMRVNYKTYTVCLGSLLLIYLIVFNKKIRNNVHILTACIIFLVGTMFAFLEPASIGVSWDDEVHYFRALNLSHVFDKKEYLVNDVFYQKYTGVAKKKYTYSEDTAKETNSFYDYLYKEKYYKSIKNMDVSIARMVYLPSALGLMVSRGLGFSFDICIMIGRWFSVWLYVILIYYAMRKLKYGKIVIASIALIPTNIFLVSNYSYDAWLTAWTILGLSYVFYEMQTKNDYITTKSMLVIAISFFLASIAKQLYFVMTIMALFLSKEKFENKAKKWIYRGLIIASMILPFVLMFFQRLLNVGAGDSRGGVAVNSTLQVEYISNHVGKFINTLINFLKIYLNPIECHKNGNSYLDNLAYNGVMNVFWIVLAVIIVGALICHGDERNAFPLWYRLGVVLMYVGVGALCAVALYIDFTPVGVDYIAGCQGRYIIPMLFPTVYVLSRFSKKQIIVEKIGEHWINCILVSVLTILNIYCLFKGCIIYY